MGKSSASCLRIIACGSDSVNEDRQTLPESKSSSDRRRWSFGKRSARHRVLSNTVGSEAPSFANKENEESSAANFQVQPNLTFPENTSVVQMTQEKNDLPAKIDSSLSEIFSVREDDCREDITIDGSSIIIIQSAIRGFLAQQVLLKQKFAIKLQAAIRGHLVRRNAVGTLRCIQGIIKMQTLVLRRRTCLLEEGSGTSEKLNGDSGKSTVKPMLLRSIGAEEPNVQGACTSIEKLLSNNFARQLMKATPRTQPINIKCEPLKSDSAWKWLERWMSVSSTSNDEPHESGFAGQKHEAEDCGHSEGKGNILAQSSVYSELNDFKPAIGPSDETSEENDLITYESDKFDLHPCSSISQSSSHPERQTIDESDSGKGITQPDPTGMQETYLISNMETQSPPDMEGAGNQQCIRDPGQLFTEQSETEANNFSVKISNPNLVASASKHVQPSSTTTSSTSTTLLGDSSGVQSSYIAAVSTGLPFDSKEIGSADASISNNSAIQFARSECGTELSISSTLDSPDGSECVANALEQGSKMLDSTAHPGSRGKSDLEANDDSHILGTELSYPNINESESCEDIDSACAKCVNPVMAAESSQLEKKLESDQSNFPGDLELDVGPLEYKSSHEASPRSRATVTESQATPSGQVSREPVKSISETRKAKRKNKRFLSTAAPNHNSPSRSSIEELPKERKTGKRRSSFGSAKPDQAHPEPRDINSCNSLPGYMQATESARAKATSNGSPRSSPDVRDRDIHIKNKGSVPGTNMRQGSSDVHHSPQIAQGTGAHSPQERKWRL